MDPATIAVPFSTTGLASDWVGAADVTLGVWCAASSVTPTLTDPATGIDDADLDAAEYVGMTWVSDGHAEEVSDLLSCVDLRQTRVWDITLEPLTVTAGASDEETS